MTVPIDPDYQSFLVSTAHDLYDLCAAYRTGLVIPRGDGALAFSFYSDMAYVRELTQGESRITP